MVCGEPVALSVMVIAAVSAPVAAGAKWPWMVQLAAIARLVPQVLAKTKEEASVPVTAMLEIDSAAVPVLVMVTDCDALDEPTVTAPNERLVAERVTGAVGATPVPLNAMLCGDVVALSVMVIAAFNAPAVLGAKWPWMVQLVPTARLVPQVLANTKEDALVPVTAMLLIDSAAVPVLVIVTDWDTLEVSRSTEPNERLVADRVTGAATPVPLKAMFCGEPVPV